MEKEHQIMRELRMERQRDGSPASLAHGSRGAQAGGSGRGHVTVIRIGADQQEVITSDLVSSSSSSGFESDQELAQGNPRV